MWNRLTETQKNFRKQMQEIEEENRLKQQNGDAGAPFYSHYRRDVVSGYYEKKKNRRRIIRGVSLGAVLLVLWNAYALYTWANHFYRSVTHHDIPVLSELIDKNGMMQRDTAEYVNSINAITEGYQGYGEKKAEAMAGIAAFPVADAEWRIAILEEQQAAIQNAASALQQIQAPDILDKHMALEAAMLDALNTECGELIAALQCTDANEYNSHINASNEAVARANQLAQQCQQALVEVFQALKMQYNVVGDQIEFEYRQ